MPDNCKENSKFPLGQSAGLFSFCFCFIPSIHVLAWCESLAAQPSLAIKEREFKSPTLVMMQQQMCSWVLTHFQPSPCLRIIKLLWPFISKCFGIPAKTQFTSQSLRNLNLGLAMRLIYMFWTGILLVTTKGKVLHLYIESFIKGAYVFFSFMTFFRVKRETLVQMASTEMLVKLVWKEMKDP